MAVQEEVDSLASMVLQNTCTLDLLTAEKGGTCLFLNEEYCCYTNKSGVVRNKAQELQEPVTKRRQELANVLLEQHKELGSLGITFGRPPFYAPPLTPIWVLHNECSKLTSQIGTKK
jgi:hypothetical protein